MVSATGDFDGQVLDTDCGELSLRQIKRADRDWLMPGLIRAREGTSAMNGFFRIYTFAKHGIAASLAAIAVGFLAATSSAQAEAQETGSGNAPVEEIVVIAFRSSLQDAMNNKRNADGIYDSIAASDIGQFPDTNLAEAIQRVPGVTIDRAQGEGRNVTVRGVNPSLNKYTLNGLTLTSGNDGQEVSFDVWAPR